MKKRGENYEVSESLRSSATVVALTAFATLLPGLGCCPAMAEVDVGLSSSQSRFLEPRQIIGASRIATTLGVPPGSLRTYRITCFDDGYGAPVRLRLRVQNRTKSAKYRVQAIISRNGESQPIVDKVNGDNLFSEYAMVTQGPGDYLLTISKVKVKPSDPENRLRGGAVIQTMQECNTKDGKYTGLYPPLPAN